MLTMTFQAKVLFLGKQREAGETIDEELVEALKSGRTTMTAVTAMKNRGYAIIGDTDEEITSDRLDRIERNLALIAKALKVDLETAETAPARKPAKGRKAA